MKTKSLMLAVIGLLVAAPLHAADFIVVNTDFSGYTFNGGPLNATITLTRGTTYTFDVSTPGHPFWIKTAQVTGTGSAFGTGVTNNGIQSGTLTFAVPAMGSSPGAPDTLFYACQFHGNMTGTIMITNPIAVEQRTWSSVKALDH